MVDWSKINASYVESQLLPICNNLTTFAKRAKCKAKVTAGVPIALKYLTDLDENPLAVCGQLRFCNVTQSANCDKCRLAVKGAEIELKKSNATTQEVIDTFLPLCNKITDPDETKLCKLALESAGPEIID